MGYYGWEVAKVMPIITTTVGAFLTVGTLTVVYLLWKEEKRKQKVYDAWREENDQ